MPRKKTCLAPISQSSHCASTYRKRKATLLRKTSELSELCGVDGCIVIYGPHDHKPDVWPSQEKTMQILSRFASVPEAQRNKNMTDPIGIVSKQVEKLQVELRKVKEENCRLESMILLQDALSSHHALSHVEDAEKLLTMSAMVELHLNKVHERMNDLLSIPKSVSPLEEVMLQGPLNCAYADIAPPSEENFSSGSAGSGVAPQAQELLAFGLDPSGSGVAPQAQELFAVGFDPSGSGVAPQAQELFAVGFDPSGSGIAPQAQELFAVGFDPSVQDQYVFGLVNDDTSQFFDCSSPEIEDILASL